MRELLELKLLMTLALLAGGWMAVRRIKRDFARVKCERTGHWAAEFKGKYQEKACCPRCGDVVKLRPIESDGEGMPVGADTVQQRLANLEKALGVEVMR